jgi:sucrose synthase
MIDDLLMDCQHFRQSLYQLFRNYFDIKKPFLLTSELDETFRIFCTKKSLKDLEDSNIAHIIHYSQEAALQEPWMYLSVRWNISNWQYFRFNTEHITCDQISVNEWLQFKEHLKEPQLVGDNWIPELDLRPFERGFPHLKETRSIGRGVEFLNRHLSGRMFDEQGNGIQKLFHFLRIHQLGGQPLLLNDHIENVEQLRRALEQAMHMLELQNDKSEWNDYASRLQKLGFETGWGQTASQIKDMMRLLSDILEAPDPQMLEAFLSLIPMIFRLLIVTPHGYFGQSNVLGLPDTGGQVVYILDQVRALEKEMLEHLAYHGIDIEPQIVVLTRLIPDAGTTNCNQRLEHVDGTRNVRILRVPFRNNEGEIVHQWISRFDIWPYLERFTIDAEKEVLAEMGGQPDLIIGNYSDGNLVASLLSQRLNVTQCNIAHALEKTKYLYSALYWKDYEEEYHFSCQFTADLISMNTADFIITSTYQEIAGSQHSIGQYESYSTFTLPGLYRVINGVNIYDPKFNIVSPGADPEIFFPYYKKDQRLAGLHDTIHQLLFDKERKDARGFFKDHNKPLLFTIARLDSIKNITGLVEWYGQSDSLRSLVNLFVVGGFTDESLSNDDDEKSQIRKMHQLMNDYHLDKQVRWINMQTDKNLVGELYRFVADSRGAFVQPAHFEAFGLTVIEAMTSGLPTFATCYGGPLEVIEHGISGFHIDPNHGNRVADLIADFFNTCKKNPDLWNKVSKGAIQRVEHHYTWKLYAKRLLSLSRIYGFCKYISNIEREETRRYLELFYSLMYRKLAYQIPLAKQKEQ